MAKTRATTQPTARLTARREPLVRRAWPYALMAALVLVFHGPMLLSPASEMIATMDIAYYFRWLHQYTYDEFMAGRLPLWNPYTNCGTPFAANPQATVFYPLSWFFMLTNVLAAHKLTAALHSLLAQIFMFMFLRRVLEPEARTPAVGDGGATEAIVQTSALFGAIIYAFGNYMIANLAVGHLTMIFTATWLPLALYCYERAFRSGRWTWLMWTGMVLGVQVLAGEPQNCYYSAVLVSMYGLIRGLVRPRASEHRFFAAIATRTLKWAASVAVIGLFAAGASAIQLLPTAEFARLSDRSANNFTFATFVSMPATSLIEFIAPWRSATFWGWGVEAWSLDVQQNWEFGGYLGILTLVLVGLSCAVRNSAAVWAMRVILLFALILVLGKNTFVYKWLYHAMPGLSMFRIPGRAMVMVHLSASVLATFGARHMLEASAGRWRTGRWRAIAIGALGLGIIAWMALTLGVGVQYVLVPNAGVKTFGERIAWSDPLVLGPVLSMAAVIALLIALKWVRSATAAAVLLGIAIAADLFANNPDVRTSPPPANDKSYEMLRAMISAADNRTQPYRIDAPPSNMRVNAALGARAEMVNGYAPMALGRYFQFVHWMRFHKASNMMRHELPEPIYRTPEAFPLRILNIRYSTRWDEAAQKYVPADETPLPRAWIVDRAEVLTDESQTLERLRDRNFDPATTVILEHPPRIDMKPGAGSPGSASCRRDEPGRLEITTTSTRDGYLVLSEMFYPGWKATMDGEPVELERADYLLTALPLPAGQHAITYRYDPLSFKIGAIVTALTWMSAIGVMIGDWRARRQRRRTESGQSSAR